MEANRLLRLPVAIRASLRSRPSITSLSIPLRTFSHSAYKFADAESVRPPNTSARTTTLSDLTATFRETANANSFSSQPLSQPLTRRADNSHHLHVFASKHNTHITLTDQKRNPIISVSCGNLGFRKSTRGTYDASYQLGSYVLNRIAQTPKLMSTGAAPIESLELILRGYGPGREATTKLLLGSEGVALRSKIVKVTDATRLKFGGTRSKKPRRL